MPSNTNKVNFNSQFSNFEQAQDTLRQKLFTLTGNYDIANSVIFSLSEDQIIKAVQIFPKIAEEVNKYETLTKENLISIIQALIAKEVNLQGKYRYFEKQPEEENEDIYGDIVPYEENLNQHIKDLMQTQSQLKKKVKKRSRTQNPNLDITTTIKKINDTVKDSITAQRYKRKKLDAELIQLRETECKKELKKVYPNLDVSQVRMKPSQGLISMNKHEIREVFLPLMNAPSHPVLPEAPNHEISPIQMRDSQDFIDMSLNDPGEDSFDIDPQYEPNISTNTKLKPTRKNSVKKNLEAQFAESTAKGLLKRGRKPFKIIRGRGADKPKSNYRLELSDKYYIDGSKFDNNILSIKYKTNDSRKIDELEISNDVKNILDDIIKGNFKEGYFNKLKLQDKIIINNLIKKLKLDVRIPEDRDIENYKRELEILQGEIESGNDNPELLRKFKKYINDGLKFGVISQKKAIQLILNYSL